MATQSSAIPNASASPSQNSSLPWKDSATPNPKTPKPEHPVFVAAVFRPPSFRIEFDFRVAYPSPLLRRVGLAGHGFHRNILLTANGGAVCLFLLAKRPSQEVRLAGEDSLHFHKADGRRHP